MATSGMRVSARRWILRNENSTVERFSRWQDVLEFYYDNVDLQNNPPAGLLGTTAKPSLFLAGDHVAFASIAAAAAHVAAAQLDANEVYVFFIGDPDDFANWELRYAEANAFTAGTTVVTEELHWRGPLLLREDVAGAADDTPEVLFDNRASTEAALGVLAGGADWGRTIDFVFARAIVEADDDADLRIRYQMTQGGQIRHFDYQVSAETFRLLVEHAAVTGNVMPTGGHLSFLGVDGRTSRNATSLFARVNIGVRQRTATGEDVLRILMSSSGNSHVAATAIRGVIELVPRVDGTAAASAQQQQQQSTGATLTRATVANGVQQTTNAFGFDVAAGGTIGVGNYAINGIPVADIFDVVASVRVGGRAAFPLRLSKEQFDLVGESPVLVQTGPWPFTGSGGGTWGDVTEIPCAMMYIDHVTDGVVKNQLNPQRQQIGWTIEGSVVATAILIFFQFDAANTNLTNVRIVAFSNSVVVIEGLHIHYWQEG